MPQAIDTTLITLRIWIWHAVCLWFSIVVLQVEIGMLMGGRDMDYQSCSTRQIALEEVAKMLDWHKGNTVELKLPANFYLFDSNDTIQGAESHAEPTRLITDAVADQKERFNRLEQCLGTAWNQQRRELRVTASRLKLLYWMAGVNAALIAGVLWRLLTMGF
jgi:hypothetical protein